MFKKLKIKRIIKIIIKLLRRKIFIIINIINLFSLECYYESINIIKYLN